MESEEVIREIVLAPSKDRQLVLIRRLQDLLKEEVGGPSVDSAKLLKKLQAARICQEVLSEGKIIKNSA